MSPAVAVVERVRRRLEQDEAWDALCHLERMSPDELDRLVERELNQ